MAAHEGPKRKGPGERREEESRAAIEKAKAEASLTRAKDEERARLKAEGALAEAREALAAAQERVEQERLARVKAEHTRAEAETALAETRKAIGVPTENMKTAPRAAAEEGEQRISFIVRLTVDERGQPRRTEVEHAQSGKKEAFPALDVQRLAAFMEMCAKPPVVPETTVPSAPLPVAQETLIPGPLGPTAGLTVSDVHLFRMGFLGVRTFLLNPGEGFMVQVRCRLHGPEARSLTVQGSSFDTRVYAREVTTGALTLLTSHSENLVGDVLEYRLQERVPGLPPGLYRLLTLVTLQAPTKMVAHYDGPVVQIAEAQPSVKAAPLLYGPLRQ